VIYISQIVYNKVVKILDVIIESKLGRCIIEIIILKMANLY